MVNQRLTIIIKKVALLAIARNTLAMKLGSLRSISLKLQNKVLNRGVKED